VLRVVLHAISYPAAAQGSACIAVFCVSGCGNGGGGGEGDGVALDIGRQLSVTRPSSGEGRQGAHPDGQVERTRGSSGQRRGEDRDGTSLDGECQLSTTQPIRSDGGGGEGGAHGELFVGAESRTPCVTGYVAGCGGTGMTTTDVQPSAYQLERSAHQLERSAHQLGGSGGGNGRGGSMDGWSAAEDALTGRDAARGDMGEFLRLRYFPRSYKVAGGFLVGGTAAAAADGGGGATRRQGRGGVGGSRGDTRGGGGGGGGGGGEDWRGDRGSGGGRGVHVRAHYGHAVSGRGGSDAGTPSPAAGALMPAQLLAALRTVAACVAADHSPPSKMARYLQQS